MSTASVTEVPQSTPAPGAAPVRHWLRFFRSELRNVFLRPRNLALLAVLAGAPVFLGMVLRINTPAPGSGGPGAGAFVGQIAGNGVFLSLFAIYVLLTVLLPLAVSVVSGDSVAGEAGLGTLRTLLTVPAGRTRLLATKYATIVVFCFAATLIVAGLGLLVGAIFFPVGPVTLLSGDTVPLADGLARLALIVVVPAAIFAMLIGSELGVIEARYQPMKIAAAEAQWTTCQPCSFSLFQIGGGGQDQSPTQIISIPHLLSLLATNSWNGKVVGLSPLQAQYQARYGPGNYVPNVFIQYWSMRVMAYTAGLLFLVSLWGLWLTRRKKLAASRWFLLAGTWAVVLPFLMNTAGWLLTESGRQPWIVQGIMLTRNGISPSVSTAALAISLTIFVLLYVTLGLVDLLLMLRYSRKELPPPVPEGDEHLPIPAVQY